MTLIAKNLQLNRLETTVKTLATALSAYYLLAVAGIILAQIGYRYGLEFMEGASLVQVQRILNGQALYVRPTLEYIPMIYPPLYFYLAAGMAKITGMSFFPLRLVSALASAGSIFLIYRFTREQTDSKQMGWLATGLFAATFALGGAWFDIARVDLLALFFCLAAFYLFPLKTPAAPWLAGLMLALAFFSKQSTLLIGGALVGYSLLFECRKALWLILTYGLLSGAALLAANNGSAGWFNYFILELPATHRLNLGYLPLVFVIIFVPLFLAFLVGVSPLFFALRRSFQNEGYRYCLFMTAGFVASSMLGTLNDGGYKNVLIPAFALLSILAALGLEQTASAFSGLAQRKTQVALRLALVAQLGFLFYNPLALIPNAADRAAGDKLVTELSAAPGEVLIPFHNYLALYAGKNVYYHQIAFEELRGAFSTRPASEWEAVFASLVQANFTRIYLDLPDQALENELCLTSQPVQYASPEAFLPVTGGQFRPTILYQPCE